MKKIFIICLSCLFCMPAFSGGLADAIRKFVESGEGQECKDLKEKIADLNNQIKELEKEYESKCVIDGTIGAELVEEKHSKEDLKCDDGSAPDNNGCCKDETYTNMGKDGYNCCPKSGGDCFPPLK